MRQVLIAFGWAATVAAAFVVGKTTAERASPVEPAETVDRPVEERPAPDPAPCSPRGAPAPTAPAARDAAAAGTGAADPVGETAGEVLEAFTLEGVTDPDVAMARIIRHVAALLAKGKNGHLEMLQFLDQHIVRNDGLEALFDSEEQAVRYIVPMIEFLVHRKGQVVGVIESVFETMAERPQLYAELDDDTLEIFTEGGAFILPGAVDEARLAKFRGYANAILETPEGSLPEPVEKQRRRLKQALMLWVPRLTPEVALAKLKAGALGANEAVQVLRRLPPEQLAGLDVGVLLAPVVAEMDYRTLRAIRDIPLQPRDVDLLDRTVLDAAAAGKARDWAVGQYLYATQRATWPEQQVFLEEGFRRGGTALETCAQALTRIGGQIPKEYFQWVLDTYELSEGTAKRLQAYVDRK